MNTKAYKKAAADLLWDSLTVVGRISELIPREIWPGSKMARLGGSHWQNHDLKMVADAIATVQYRFDQLQHILGLPDPEAARFGHAPAPGASRFPDTKRKEG